MLDTILATSEDEQTYSPYGQRQSPYTRKPSSVTKRSNPFSITANPFGKADNPFGGYALQTLLTETDGEMLLEIDETIIL